MKRIPKEDEARIRELAEEYNIPLYVVRSLYDGIVAALEDMEAESLPEEFYGEDSTLDYKDSEDGKDD